MRFIDEQELWPGIRFQIDLGKYTLTQYDKQVLGESIPRSVVENTRAFGRLSNFLTADPDSLEQRIDVDHRANGFEQFAPHYNADINKIGIAFTEKEQLPYIVRTKNAETNRVKYSFKQPQPDAFISLHELAKAILLEQLQPGESEKLIRAFCSTAENKLFNPEFIESIKWKLPDWKPFQKQCDTKKSRAYITKRNMYYNAQPTIFARAKELRENMTPAEKVLWEKLRCNQLSVRFKAQHPIDIFIADFYCHRAKLVIEVDGAIHATINFIDTLFFAVPALYGPTYVLSGKYNYAFDGLNLKIWKEMSVGSIVYDLKLSRTY